MSVSHPQRGAQAPLLRPHPCTLVLAVSIALLGLGAPAAGVAQVAGTAPSPADAAVRAYAISAGPLASVLRSLASQAGVPLTFTPDQTDGRHSAGVRGALTPAQAFAAALAGSGLQAVRQDNGGYVLQAVPPSQTAVLPVVAVTAERSGGGVVTEGSGSYAVAGPLGTATGLGLTLRETPQSVSVITRDKMEDFSLTNLSDALNQMPGVYVDSYDSERTAYSARGFTIQDIQYDGTPTTISANYAAGNTLSETAIYDRVEVLKGAASLLNGAGQPGAVLNLVRKRPTAVAQRHITLGAGSWRNYSAEVDISGPLSEDGRIRGRAVAAYRDQHSFMDGHKRKTPVLYGILEADLTPDTLLTAGLDYQTTDPTRSSWGGTRPIYDRYGNRISALPRSYNNGANWSSWQQTSASGFASLEHRFSNQWKIKAAVNRQYNGYDAKLGSILSGPYEDGTSTIFANKFVGRTKTDSLDLVADGSFHWLGREHDLVLGGQISRAHWTGEDYYDVTYPQRVVDDFWNWNGDIAEPLWGEPSFTGDTTRQSAIYATTRLAASDNLKILLGGRLSNYHYKAPNSGIDFKQNSNFVPYAGVVYDLSKNISWYASYTSIFKPQNYRDESGKLLDPLNGKSYETGLKGEFFDGLLNASAAYFQIKQDNYPERLGDTLAPDGTPAYRGIQGVVAKGLELEAAGELTRNLQLQGSFNHVIARQSGARVLTNAPENMFKLYASYRADALLQGLKLGGGVRWQSRTYRTIMNYGLGVEEEYSQSAYSVFDLMARYELSKELTLGVKVNNLFDKAYLTNVGLGRTIGYGEPRSVHVNMTYKF